MRWRPRTAVHMEVSESGSLLWRGPRRHLVYGTLPQCQSLLHLVQEASVEFVDWVNVGEEQGHQGSRHGVLLDHHTSEPLWGQQA